MTTRAARLAALLAFSALAVAPGVVGAADESVEIVDFGFEPAGIEITVGDVVTWTNTASRTHTVTSDDGTFDSGELGAGDPFANVFATAGRYAYHCTIHPEMTGVVVVTAAATSAAASASAEPTPPTGSLPPSAAPTSTPSGSAGPSDTAPPSPTASPEPAPDRVASEGPPLVAIVAAIVVAVVVALFVIPMPGKRPR